MTEIRHILLVRRTDSDGEHILLQVSPSGNKTLDLKLVASENEHVYPTMITESKVKALQASNYSGNLDEWKMILRYALLRHQPAAPLPDALQGLEMVAALGGTVITITLRKNIGGIHQRLGSIKLEQNDAEAIDFFDWAVTAVASSDGLRDELDTLQTSVKLQREQTARLNQQLDDLVKAKKEHEEELLKKFAALLNAKKLKIRDQQRLLAGAKVDPKTAAAVSRSRNGTSDHRKAGDSRTAKRQANGANLELEEASEDEVVAEEGRLEDDDLMREQETPQQTEDDATEGDDDGEADFDAAPSSLLVAGRGVNSKHEAVEGPSDGPMSKHSDAGSPPPRRELPFARKGAHVETEAKRPDAKISYVAAAEEDDDKTDDEL
ncbi:hypothetical protein LTR91_012461 [Friedmanniomyces endolithicus]|uniref:XRCC4 coiled-coil domain-containing protein n=1 Tax=Friedmanniomyces endolithicus TaxID=329885 RepID=A0AAN6JFP6_9PEZI|nr:hypothetical protein LTR35_004757 [Friedmanniomyces endolithicus]KAK0299222.1 hypothetical protein LTS00_002333 [Friedmanniomyces endolithicus]KAK0306673.1 hypothetical protein LTR01_005968 [Friedmanniomyces endolithicus]KAK0322680.1 hypothetical protein LTR82_006136 [Friedmanniomyces endolithicus]KAK0825404.1 hypothetical protein LTR73_006950 [Friedmanniomyces endolithicus]